MKITRSEMSAANLISCVTMSIVMDTLMGEVPDHVQDLSDQLGIECRRHFVEQHDPGPHGERTGDPIALLLAA